MEKMSDVTTQGVRVGATAFYLPDESDPAASQFVFGYRVVISNEGTQAAQLLSRHWIIVDAVGRREEVQGEGVVGETPTLAPGQAFKYTSYCPLRTPWGTMEGSYEFERPDGSRFRAAIARFYLVKPREEVKPAGEKAAPPSPPVPRFP